MSDIDPQDFGRLKAEVDHLKQTADKMSKQLDELMALANQSKGGFWVGMSIASLAGAIVTFVAERLLK